MRKRGVDVKPGRKYKVLCTPKRVTYGIIKAKQTNAPTHCTRTTTTYVKKPNETEREGDRALQRVESRMERYETCGLVVSGTPGPKGKRRKWEGEMRRSPIDR